MVSTTTVYTCDICGRSSGTNNNDFSCEFSLSLPFITNCDWIKGMPTKDRVEFEKVDICRECLLKSTNLRCDFRGKNKRLM